MTELEELQQAVDAKTQEVAQLETTLADLQEQLRQLQEQIEEGPWEVTCSACGARLVIAAPVPGTPVAQVVTTLYCPVCEAPVWEAPTEGYTVTLAAAAEKPWYKKYAPHLAIGGTLAGAIVYLTIRKK